MSLIELQKLSKEELAKKYLELQLRVSKFSSVEQELINTKDRLDSEMFMHKRMNYFSQQAFNKTNEHDLLKLAAESVIDIFEFEVGIILLANSEKRIALQYATEGVKFERDKAFKLFNLVQTNLNYYENGVVLQLNKGTWSDLHELLPFHQLMVTRVAPQDSDVTLYFIGGVLESGALNYNPVEKQRADAFGVFAQQVLAQFVNHKKASLIEDSEKRLTKLANVFLGFGSDPIENIQALTKLARELLNGDFSFYKGLDKMDLFAYSSGPRAEHPYLTVEDVLFIKGFIRNAPTDFYVDKHVPETVKLRREKEGKHVHLFRTLGRKVILDEQFTGVLAVCFENGNVPGEEETQMLNIIASAIAVEEKRYNSLIALSESEERYRSLFEGTPHGTVILNPINKNLVYANPAFCTMFGFMVDEVKHVKFEMLHPELSSTFLSLKDSSVTNQSLVVECKRKDGSVFHAEISSQPVQINHTDYLACFYVDISLQKKAQDELIQNNAELKKINSELDNFVYSVSHDLRAPLLAIKGLISLIQSGGNLDEGSNAEFLQLVNDSVIRMDETIKEILEYSRNARLAVKPERINLVEMATLAHKDVRYYSTHPVELFLDIEPGLEFVSDRSRLNTVLKNLVANSVKYARTDISNSFVKVSAFKKDKDLILQVSDNGEGISEHHQKKVFQMFFRGSNKTTGTGLGLYITSEIIQKLGGEITLESVKNQGTTISIRLPLEYQE